MTSLRARFLVVVLLGPGDSSLAGRDLDTAEGESTRRLSIGARRVWMGGKELFPEEMLPRDCVLKACAKEGRDCGTCVVMLPWLTAMVGEMMGKGDTRGEEWEIMGPRGQW